MKQQPIPAFEGRKPDKVSASFSGKPDNDPIRPHHVGEDVTLVIRAKVTGVAHKTAAGGAMARTESFNVAVAFELDDAEGNNLIERLHTEYAEATGENVLQLTPDEADEEFGVEGDYEDDTDGE